MDALSTEEIIYALAQGIHPLTGERLPDDSPYNEPVVIRALFAVTRVLGRQAPKRQRRQELPPNAGKPWTEEDDRTLGDRFGTGAELKELAAQFGRTRWALQSRLLKLGLATAAG